MSAPTTLWSRDDLPKYFRPFPWTVAPDNRVTTGCPSRPTILITFLVVNIVVAIISIIFGNRKIVKLVTFGLMGKNPNSKLYRFLWILPVGFNLTANAINASIMKNSPGYGELFSISSVVLFYTTRPRITWFLSAFLTVPWAGKRDDNPDHWSSNWVSFAYTQGFAELALQAISLYTLIIAQVHGKQLEAAGIVSPKGKTYGNLEMVIGALGWVVLFGVSLIIVAFLVLFVMLSCCGTRGNKRENEDGVTYTKSRSSVFSYGWVGVAVIGVALGCNWVFWDGYLREFPEEYCPPKLTIQAVIWSLFAALGVPFGVAF